MRAQKGGDPPQFGTAARPAPHADGSAEGWPLASPLPPPPVLPSQRGEQETRPRPAPRPEDEYLLRAPITAIPGVGATQAARLRKLGIETVRDLLFTFPREHHDYSKLQKIQALPFGEVSTILGRICEVEHQRTSGRRTKTVASISDETGGPRRSGMQQAYLRKPLAVGA